MKILSRSIPVGVRFGLQIMRESSGCWVWVGSRSTNGYGAIYYKGEKWTAHRLSWVLHHGEIPEGLCVLHQCDNPPCVNPEHLFLGTIKDNAQDAIAKGRFPRLKVTSKLTAEQVEAIRTSKQSAKQIAAQFSITIWTVYDIRRGRSWSHIKQGGAA